MLEMQLHAAQQALINTEEELQTARDFERRLQSVTTQLESRVTVAEKQLTQLMCVSCTKGLRSVLFLPCLHALYCTACAQRASVVSCTTCGVAVTASLPFSTPIP